mmetsp:Transcript_1702/g.1806  ORF Transcript_1702/g.1806 Transcript_1702/m.1806 type:complete len:442 (-) Transcript_1702:504-1829(-)
MATKHLVEEAEQLRVIEYFEEQYENFTYEEIVGLEFEREKLEAIFNRTFDNDENQSLILIGPRSSGKSFLCSKMVEKVKERVGSSCHVNTIVVNGMIYNNDMLGLREIARQMNIVDEASDATFLSILEQVRAKIERENHIYFFILEEVDQWAQGQRKQNLLYSFFNMIQTSSGKILLIGTTTHLDITENLEKRIKSRFSNRQVLFLDYSFEDICSILKQRLQKSRQGCSSKSDIKIHEYLLATLDEEGVRNCLLQQFDKGQPLRFFLNLIKCTLVFFLSKDFTFLKENKVKAHSEFVNHFQTDMNYLEGSLTVEIKPDLFRSISMLHKLIVFSVKRLHEREYDRINFIQVQNEFRTVLKISSSATIFNLPRRVIFKAYTYCLQVGLLEKIEGSEEIDDFTTIRLNCDCDEINSMIAGGKFPDVTAGFSDWARNASKYLPTK